MHLISKKILNSKNLRFFSSIFEVLRQKNKEKPEILTKNCILKPNVKTILKRYSSIDPLPSNITFNEFIKNVDHLRSLNMDALYHLPYYKCEDISSIINFLSKIKYRDVIILQGLCEALYWQCNINKARLTSITSVLSNLTNLYYVPHYRICKKFIDELDNPKNKQAIGDYLKIYKFLSLTSLYDSNYFIPIYERVETKCLNSMGIMNHSQLSLLSTILLNYPGGKWELMSKICDNFHRRLHETPVKNYIKLLKNVNKLKNEFKLPPRHYIPLLTQMANTNTLSNSDILYILKTMSIYYIRDTPLLSKLGNLLSERNDLSIPQQIVVFNIFSQLCYKHKEFLLSRPLDHIIDGLNKYKLIKECKTNEEIKTLFPNFYPHVSLSPIKFVEYSIAYINCLAKVNYNKRTHIKKSLEIITLSTLIKNTLLPSSLLLSSSPSPLQLLHNTLRTFDSSEMGLWPIPRRCAGTSVPAVVIFNYSKTGLVRIDPSVKELLHSKVISDIKPLTINTLKSPQKSSPFDSLDSFRESIKSKSKDTKRLEVPLPENCTIYRTKTALELHTNFWNRTFGEYVNHPAHKRLYNRKLYRKMIEIVFKRKRKNKNELKAYTPSKLYNTSVFLETSSGLTDKDEIRKFFLKRKRYSGSFRSFESNLSYINKWRLLRRCFLRPYFDLYQAFYSLSPSKSSYINFIVECYKNPSSSKFSFDSFVNNKSKFIYDTRPILEMDSKYVKMRKTIRESKRIRDSYMDKWKNEVDKIHAHQTYSINVPETKPKVSGKKKFVNMLVRGLESLIKLKYFNMEYLKYVFKEIEKNIEDSDERKELLDKIGSAIGNLDTKLLEENKECGFIKMPNTLCEEPNVAYTQSL